MKKVGAIPTGRGCNWAGISSKKGPKRIASPFRHLPCSAGIGPTRLWDRQFENPSRMLKKSTRAQATARDRVISSARLYSRTMNKIVLFRPMAARSTIFGKVFRGPGIKRWLHMRLASETTRSPAFPPSVRMTRFFSNVLGQLLRTRPDSPCASSPAPFAPRPKSGWSGGRRN